MMVFDAIVKFVKNMRLAIHRSRHSEIGAPKDADFFTVPKDKWNDQVKIKINAGDIYTIMNAAIPKLMEVATEEQIEASFTEIASQLNSQGVLEFHNSEDEYVKDFIDAVEQYANEDPEKGTGGYL